jgi:hypothetical protein
MTSRPPLFPHFYGRFVEQEGRTIVDGKIFWPASIVVHFDRHRTLKIIEALARQLQQLEPTDCTIDFVGEIYEMERE